MAAMYRGRRVLEDQFTDRCDGRPTVGYDALLEALVREHGEDTVERDVAVPSGQLQRQFQQAVRGFSR